MTMNEASPPVAVLFADVCGNARLHEKLGSTEALRAADRCLKRMERAVDGFGGRIAKSSGEELMAVFQTADEALQAAVEMQERVADLPPVSGVKLDIRVGFTYGSVLSEDGELSGETVKLAAQLAGLARPGQALTSESGIEALSSVWQKKAREMDVLPAQKLAAGTRLFELLTHEILPGVPGVAAASFGGSTAGGSIRFKYRGENVVLDEQRPVLMCGRDAESDIVIHDRRASRHHARIERRGDVVVLVDQSTNGTFLRLNGRPEIFVRRGECMLQGPGVLSFASSATSPDSDFAEFEQI